MISVKSILFFLILFVLFASCGQQVPLEGCYQYKHTFNSVTMVASWEYEFCFSNDGNVVVKSPTIFNKISEKELTYKVVGKEIKTLGFDTKIPILEIEIDDEENKRTYVLKFKDSEYDKKIKSLCLLPGQRVFYENNLKN